MSEREPKDAAAAPLDLDEGEAAGIVMFHGHPVDLDRLDPGMRSVVMEAAIMAEGEHDAAGADAVAADKKKPLVIPPVGHITVDDLASRYGHHFSTIPGRQIQPLAVPDNGEVIRLLAIKAGAEAEVAGLARSILYAVYEPLVHSYLRRRYIHSAASQSDAMLGLVRMIEDETLQGRTEDFHFTKMFYGMLRHKVNDGYRDFARERHVPTDDAVLTTLLAASSYEEGGPSVVDRLTDNDHLRLLLGALSVLQRDILVLRDVHEIPATDIAQATRSSPDAVRITHLRALRKSQELVFGTGKEAADLQRRVAAGDIGLRDRLLAKGARKAAALILGVTADTTRLDITQTASVDVDVHANRAFSPRRRPPKLGKKVS